MIDEKKLIEQLKQYKSEWKLAEPFHEGIASGLKIAIEVTERQPKVDEWIPCSERLPNCNGTYQITRKIIDGEYIWRISDSAYFDGQNTWHSDNRVNHERPYLTDILAWKPLDEPYKEEVTE